MANLELLSRIQFGITIGFHYLFPPLTIGLGLILAIMEGVYMRTKNPLYHQMTRFWVRVFGLIFAMGVASGVVMEFQFGTNWAPYTRFVGDIFGSALAAEGIFAFFLESGSLGILLFGWNRVKPRTHFIATILVAAAAHFSAVWIVAANSWQQTPAGYRIVSTGSSVRAELVDYWQAILNPSFLNRISHTLMGCWQAGAFLVLSVSAFYILRKRHIEFAKASMRIAIIVALFSSLMQLVTGHSSAKDIASQQPAKLAAIEGVYPAHQPAGLHIFGWIDEDAEKVYGLQIPGLLSYLVHGDSEAPITGLRAFPPEDRPPANLVFQSFHLMVACGMILILLSVAGAFAWWRGSLFESKWLLTIFVFSVLLPEIANELGWFTAEVGRQPWIVYGLMRTSEGFSAHLGVEQVWLSLILFVCVYLLLLALFLYLLNHKIQRGPSEEAAITEGRRA